MIVMGFQIFQNTLRKRQHQEIIMVTESRNRIADLIDEINNAKSQFASTGKNLNDYFRDLNDNSENKSKKGKNLCNT